MDPLPDCFDELPERSREIRASERRFYQKVIGIYALAADYDARAADARVLRHQGHQAEQAA